MNKMNEFFENTPLQQNDLILYDTGYFDSHEDTYSPFHIKTWNFGHFRTGSPPVMNMCLHEMSHVIDFHLREKNGRLLMQNYGFPTLTGETGDTTLTRHAAILEIRVLQIHDILVQLFPEARAIRPPYQYNVYKHFRSRGLQMDVDEWIARLGNAPNYTVEYLCNAFQAAVAFIRDNRAIV